MVGTIIEFYGEGARAMTLNDRATISNMAPEFGATAALFAEMGHAVPFVSVTNGDAGHQTMRGAALARRRADEARESARRLGIEYEVLNSHDGELLPTLEVRKQIIRQIRLWKADVVLAPRPNDYHPDHRYTGVLVQDAAYMVVVPNVVPEVPPLRRNPIFLYYEDTFQEPSPSWVPRSCFAPSRYQS